MVRKKDQAVEINADLSLHVADGYYQIGHWTARAIHVVEANYSTPQWIESREGGLAL